MVVPVSHVLVVSLMMFGIGVVGVMTRRNAIVVLMSVELILNAANLNFVAFARMYGDLTGQIFSVFVIAVAAGEVAVGLAILIAFFRNKPTPVTTRIITAESGSRVKAQFTPKPPELPGSIQEPSVNSTLRPSGSTSTYAGCPSAYESSPIASCSTQAVESKNARNTTPHAMVETMRSERIRTPTKPLIAAPAKGSNGMRNRTLSISSP